MQPGKATRKNFRLTDLRVDSPVVEREALVRSGDGAGDDQDSMEAALLAEQIRMLMDRRIDLPINMLNATLLSAIVWRLFPTWLVWSWLGTFSAVILFRALSRRSYRKGPYDAGAMRRWGRIFTLNACMTGCLWGLTGSVILITTDPIHDLFIVFLLGGMMAGGIVSNSSYLPAMYGFMLPTVLPVIAALIGAGGAFHFEMAALLTVFAFVLVFAGRDINRSILNNVRLRIGQGLLADQLRASEMAMAEVQKIAQVGGLEVDIVNDRIICTAETFHIFGVDPAMFKLTFETMVARIHPDDRMAVRKAFADFRRAGVAYDLDCRVVMDNGQIKYLHAVSRVIDAPVHGTARLFATVQDVTVRKLEDAKLSFANVLLTAEMEASPDGILVVDSNQNIISSNQLFATIWKIPSAVISGASDDHVLAAVTSMQTSPEKFRERVEYLYRNPGEDGRDELQTSDGRTIDRYSKTLMTPTKDYLGRVWFFRDITERRRIGDELAYRDRLLHAVTDGTRILVKAETPDHGMPEALRIVCESMRVDRVLVMEENVDSLIHPKMRYTWQVQGCSVDFEPYLPPPSDDAAIAVWRAPLREGKPVLAQLESVEAPVRKMLEWLHNKSTLVVPIFIGERLWGSLAVDSISVIREWTTTEIDTLKTFGDIAGALIAHHEAGLALERSEERFRILGSTAADAIIMMDGAGRINSWNTAAERILGYSAQEAIGRELHELLTPVRFLEKTGQAMNEFRAPGGGDEVGTTRQLTARRKDGVEIAIELSMAGAQVGTDWQAIGILRDITERNAAEKKLQFANILLTTEMEASLDGILVVDANRTILSSNKQFREIWKVPQAIFTAGDDGRLLSTGATLVKNPERFTALVESLYENNFGTSNDEFEMLDGRSIERHTVPLTSDSGNFLGRIWFFRDITERKRAAAQALRMARFDVLTGLANRSVFVEAVDIAVGGAKRGGPTFAVIYLDLDHFKDVNDTLGHPAGDALLREVAVRLRSNTRELDTVARFGGDEFAIVLEDIKEPANAASVAEKLIAALSIPYVIRGDQIYSGASIGIDLYGPEAANAEVLLSHADVALYRAKLGGRSGYRFFTDAMDAEVRTQVSLGTELHEAIDKGQFFLEYQPQVAVANQRIVGVEALIRWRHPKRGILNPDIFIPIAEKSGLIINLGRWVLQTACVQMKEWIDEGIEPMRVAVNLSAVQFKSPAVLEADIVNILHATGLPPRWLELELTETVLMKVSSENNDIMIRLRKLGVTIAIDDFGTGFSSLAYLRRFKVDRIKIAQNFVMHLGSEPGDASIVRATIGLARELGIMAIAEGVENSEQLALLTSWGCLEVQGFYFANPLMVSEITHLLVEGGMILPKASSK